MKTTEKFLEELKESEVEKMTFEEQEQMLFRLREQMERLRPGCFNNE